jgi:hypothetical protein
MINHDWRRKLHIPNHIGANSAGRDTMGSMLRLRLSPTCRPASYRSSGNGRSAAKVLKFMPTVKA